MRIGTLLLWTALPVLISAGSSYAVEINIIDKTYSEQEVLKGRTLQSDLDRAEQSGKQYVPKKYIAPAPAQVQHAAPEKEYGYDNDAVYTVDDSKPSSNNLQDDLDTIKQPDAAPVPVQPVRPSSVPKDIPPSPVSNAEPMPPAMPEQIPSPIREDDVGTSAPSERAPVLLGKMSNDDLKKELGIKEKPPMKDTNDIIAPPDDVFAPESFSPSIQ